MAALKGLAAASAGGAIRALTAAEDRVANDVLALSALGADRSWVATISGDSRTERTAAAVLRKALGLPAARTTA